MFTLEQLEQKKAAVLNQQKVAEQMFHQCNGALALINEQIEEVKKAAVEESSVKEREDGQVDNESAQ